MIKKTKLNKDPINLQFLFGLFFILGCFLIISSDIIFSQFIFGNLFGYSSSEIIEMKNSTSWLIIVTLLSAILLIVYTILGHKRRDEDVPLEQFADSCYYLGFLFTLVSLIFALHNIEVNDDTSWTMIGNVIEKNSIALVTTVVGLFIRVFLVQFQASSDQQREQILKRMFNEFEKLTTVISISINEIKKINEIETSIQGIFNTLTKYMNQLNQSIKQNAIEAYDTKKYWENFTDIISTTKSTMKGYNIGLDNIKETSNEASSEIKILIKEMKIFGKSLKDFEKYQNEVVKNQKKIKNANDEAEGDLEKLRTTLLEVTDLLQQTLKQSLMK